MIVVLGFEFFSLMPPWAAKYPNIDFVYIDNVQPGNIPNLVSAIFREDEAGYIAGAGAGLITRTRV